MLFMQLDRISIEVTRRCAKSCSFCYNGSSPAGGTSWTPQDLIALVQDCAANGIGAVSFGGGEPLEYEPIFDVLTALSGGLFRSVTTNGLLLSGTRLDRLVAAAPDKVHVSIHFPERSSEVTRVVRQVRELEARGIRSGINLLVGKSSVAAAERAAAAIRAAGLGSDRIVYLPMRGRDTPSPREVAQVAGSTRFQSMSCLVSCGKSPRFCSIGWDRTAAWCSYTSARAPLRSPSYEALAAALRDLDLTFCGDDPDGTEQAPIPLGKGLPRCP